MRENETNVAPEGTSPEPAKTAENETIVSSPGAPPAAPIELPQETNVSAMLDRILTEVRSICAPFRTELEQTIEKAKVDIIAKVTELVTPVVAKSAESAALPRYRPEELVIPPPIVEAEDQAPEAHNLAVGDPVKVWADPNHKTFLLGTIAAVHGQGGAFDVETDDGVTKIPADGLEFDDRR